MAWTNSYSMKQTGAFLKNVRKEKGLTQEIFAETIGVSHATLSSLENGGSVSSKTFEKAFNFLGLRLIIVPKTAVVTVDERLPQSKKEDNRV